MGEKEYAAAPLRITEIAAAHRTFAKIQKAAAEGSQLERIAEGLEELARIIGDAVRRVDTNVLEDHVAKVSTPEDLLYAFKALSAEYTGTFGVN